LLISVGFSPAVGGWKIEWLISTALLISVVLLDLIIECLSATVEGLRHFFVRDSAVAALTYLLVW